MSPPSAAQSAVLAELRAGPRQAQEVAAALGIQTSAARSHLEALAELGLAEASLRADGRGRPKKRFALTDAGRESFAQEYALLAERVLASVAERGGRTELEAVALDVARDLASGVTGATTPERLRSLVRAYNALGFEASLDGKTREPVLVQRNCAFLRLARNDPNLLCRCLDEGIIRAALPGADVTLEASQAMGAPTCRHRIGVAATKKAA